LGFKRGLWQEIGINRFGFPKLVFMPNMYEYSDGLYDMYTGSLRITVLYKECSLARLTPWFIQKSYLLFWRNWERRKNDACVVFSRRVVLTWKIVNWHPPYGCTKNSTYKVGL
jgi:hypothetical protein